MQNDDRITGVFVWDVSSEDVRFRIIQYSIDYGANSYLKVIHKDKRYCNKYSKICNKIDLYNIDLYKKENRFRKLVGIDVLFDTCNRFVEVGHSRISLPVLRMGSYKGSFRIDNVREYIFLSFISHGIIIVDDWGV